MIGTNGETIDPSVVMGQMIIGIILLVAVLILWKRIKYMHKPMSRNSFRIILPLFFMTPVVYLFMDPRVHLSVAEIAIPAVIGFVFSLPLIWTTVYEIREDGHIYMKKDIWFFVTFLGILSLRFILRDYLRTIEPINFSCMAMIIGSCYLVPWRIASFIKFRKVLALTTK
ncbi:cytochrome c biogenesis protein CcdC [Paenibacillus albiflavus]|uniref:Cytochrome c biogenesis protein CcdC n=1 Tax=Paenibacillus albiflavus TaxID=2545760 RepID=A0A4R4EG57_9BACL|nr:cytochrome c biogenesis protein CcdC [Paenibacillus albiflavus]TCZ78273.1 cytochrome c biogenesis protein CcdC [Paenibacillus albiflavus]